MKAALQKVSENHKHQMNFNSRRSAEKPPASSSFSSNNNLSIQRSPLCPCGGGCPRCCNDNSIKTELPLQRSSANQAEPSTVPPIVHEVLRSPGNPLDQGTRTFMGPRFGHDFSQVRVHTDAKAAESVRVVNALAYTVGRDLVFAAGQYMPATTRGQRLLAHELTHVVQQEATVPNLSRWCVSEPGEPAEVEAELAASDIINRPATPTAAPGAKATLGTRVSGRLMRTIAYDPDCQARKKEVEGNVSRAQASAARWARAALTSLAIPKDVASLLRRHFNVGATDAAAVARMRSAFEAIAADLDADAFTYHCRPKTDASCQSQDGKEIAGFTHSGIKEIFFCDPYPYQNFFGHKNLIETLLHEAAHAHDNAFNHDTYEWMDSYPGANPLTNADSYASFARDAALGRRGKLGLELDISLGALANSEPQFYIAVSLPREFGGPALDVFNLKAGWRIGFMPRTEREPERRLFAADIGLRINPIRKRVYVDLTTGAFLGENFSDKETMAGIANRLTAGYRGDRVDLGLDLSDFYDFVGRNEHLLIVGVRTGIRF